MNRWKLIRRLHVIALVAAVTACSEPTSPDGSSVSQRFETEETTPQAPALISCPTDQWRFRFALIGPLGGTLALDGHLLSFPQGALSGFRLSLVSLIVPPSEFMEVNLSVNGALHTVFGEPVTVVIDYSRCTGPELDASPLRVWQIDPFTKAFIADMGGVDDKVARTVTFTTDHFSGYAIAQ